MVSQESLYFCGISCNVSLYLSCFIWVSSFFLQSLAKVYLFNLFKEKHFLAIVFLVSILFIFDMIFAISFFLLIWGLVCSFSSVLKCTFGFVFSSFFLLNIGSYLWSFFFIFIVFSITIYFPYPPLPKSHCSQSTESFFLFAWSLNPWTPSAQSCHLALYLWVCVYIAC